jgi:hypothetical protein
LLRFTDIEILEEREKEGKGERGRFLLRSFFHLPNPARTQAEHACGFGRWDAPLPFSYLL